LQASPAHFEELFRLTAASVQPRNVLDVLNIWQSVCATWSANRFNRHATVAIERHAQQTRVINAERAKLRQLRRSNQESNEVRKLTQTPTDIAYVSRLDINFDDMVEDTDKILERGDLERDHNKSLLALLDSQEKLNRLIIGQTAIKNDAYRQIELCRFGLSELAGEEADSVIEGECKEIKHLPPQVDAPSIILTGDAGSDVETK